MAHREGITTDPVDWTLIKASKLIKGQKVILIDGSLPVEEACNTLINNNVSSAPVYDSQVQPETSIVHPRSYIGMFDYGDVIAYLLLVFRNKTEPLDETIDTKEENLTFEIRDIVRRAKIGEEVPVKLASDLSNKNPFYSILHEATLLSAVEEFACGTHRVCVLNNEGIIEGILSQSTIGKYLFENQHHFPDIERIFKKTLKELNLGLSEVLYVGSDSPVLDALELMSKHGISSVAVFGNMGTIIGNISLTDVKHVIKNYRQDLLWKTCFQFVSLVQNEQGIEDGQDRLPVFDVRLDTTLRFTLAKLLATKSHRVWVTDENERAIGVVSITDVMKVVAMSVIVNDNKS